MINAALELVLSRLEKVKVDGKGHLACCPAHEDQNPSLSIGQGDDGRVLLYCHVDCKLDAICAAIGLKQSDLFAPKEHQPPPRPTSNNRPKDTKPVKAWPSVEGYGAWFANNMKGTLAGAWYYEDADGRPVMVIVRVNLESGKTFRPMHVVEGGWALGDPDGLLPLFGLPTLAGKEVVYVVEGEKCVEAARSIGLTATTSAHGSKAASKSDWGPLAGREVVILPDNDAAGKKYAKAACGLLTALGPRAKVRIVNLPDLPAAGDICDWLEAHDSVEPDDLRKMIEELAERASYEKASAPALQTGALVSNVIRETFEEAVLDSEGNQALDDNGDAVTKRKKRVSVKPYAEIVRELNHASGDWPRRAGGVPFAVNPTVEPLPAPDAIHWFKAADDLFGWVKATIADADWHRGKCTGMRDPVSRPEFYAQIRATAKPNYETIELLPHYPLRPNTYYVPCNLPEATGKAIEELCSTFNAASNLDRDLLKAALVTPFWGGPPGQRPAFCFTSEFGVGVGKTMTAAAIAGVAGGFIDVGNRPDWEKIRSRLLDDSALTKRIVMLDNAKGVLQDSDFESAITSDTINGKRMYVGDATRPNTLCWFITLNAARMSRDLSDRSVLIQIGEANRTLDFKAWLTTWMKENRPALIADILAFLAAPASCSIRTPLRFATWRDDILTRFANGEEMAAAIVERTVELDIDAEDVGDVIDAIRKALQFVDLNPDDADARISKSAMATILRDAGIVDRRKSVKGCTAWLREHLKIGNLKEWLCEGKSGALRYWRWCCGKHHFDNEALPVYDDSKQRADNFRHDEKAKNLWHQK